MERSVKLLIAVLTILISTNLLSAEKFIAGIKIKALGIVVIAIMSISTKASKL